MSALPPAIVKGELILLIEGTSEALLLDMRQIDMRGIEQPQTEQVIRGPREGYVEKLENNLALLRYRLQSTDFRISPAIISARSGRPIPSGVKAPICLMFLCTKKRIS